MHGAAIRTSLFEGMADWMTVPLLSWDYGGVMPGRVGLNHPSIAPYGAYPTSVYRYYDFDGDHITEYQRWAREGGEAYRDYLQRNIYDCECFDDYLERSGGVKKLRALREAMLRMM
jgi:crotonobetainyl-CoA:carnitine CoA-transferase CaiB-like acyl-CoA transferase